MSSVVSLPFFFLIQDTICIFEIIKNLAINSFSGCFKLLKLRNIFILYDDNLTCI